MRTEAGNRNETLKVIYKTADYLTSKGLNLNFIAFFAVCSKVGDHLKDLGADGGILLMFILIK
jgi:hypothetical protein